MGMNQFVPPEYNEQLKEWFEKQWKVWERFEGHLPPLRASHRRPPTDAEIADFEEWKKVFEYAIKRGWDEGWLGVDYDEDPRPLDSHPPVIVYDETEEEHKARVEAWRAAQPPRQGYITFPVRRHRDADRRPEEGLDE